VSRDTREPSGEVTIALSDVQLGWLAKRARAELPPVSTVAMLERLVDEAMAASKSVAHEREHQLEVYRASGYPEHHPDYPDSQQGRRNV
jgi:hypothetical protein